MSAHSAAASGAAAGAAATVWQRRGSGAARQWHGVVAAQHSSSGAVQRTTGMHKLIREHRPMVGEGYETILTRTAGRLEISDVGNRYRLRSRTLLLARTSRHTLVADGNGQAVLIEAGLLVVPCMARNTSSFPSV